MPTNRKSRAVTLLPRRAFDLEDVEERLRRMEAVLRALEPNLVAVVSLRGRLRWLSPHAGYAIENALRVEESLPMPLARYLANARAVLSDGGPPTSLPAAEITVVTRSEPATFHLSLHAPPDGPFVAIHRGHTEELTRAAERFDLLRGEVRVLDGLQRGLSNAEIGRELYISENTVRTHVQRILRKMGVDSRMQAVALLKQPR
jgi:DNA-binding NarL/FixJ family response regulator